MNNVIDEHVAIFWDYENCTPPCNVPGYDVVNNIRQVAHEYGSVKLFKAYLELSEQSSSKSIGLRSELQSCGVSLTDCPHNGRKDVADKMMIVDMLTYAIDNPAPATIVLISGDRDFVYAVSVLRLRRYRVVVVAPYTAHASLKSQASAVLDWEADIMRKTTLRSLAPESCQTPAADDALHRSPRRPSFASGGTLPPAMAKQIHRPSFRAAASAPNGLVDEGKGGSSLPFSGRHLRSTSSNAFDSTLRDDISNHMEREYTAYHGGLGRRAFRHALNAEDDYEGDLSDHQPIPDIVEVLGDLQEHVSIGSPATGRLEMPVAPSRRSPSNKTTPVETLQESALPPSPLRKLSEVDDITETPNGLEEGVPLPPAGSSTLGVSQSAPFPYSGYQPPIMRPATVEPQSRVSSEFSPMSTTITSLETSDASSSSPSGEHQEHGDPPTPQPQAPQPPALTTTQTVPVGTRPPATLPAIGDPKPSAQKAEEPPSHKPTTSVPIVDPPSPPKPPLAVSVPPKYEPLVRALKEFKGRGDQWPLRTRVAVRLMEIDPKAYIKAGVTSFKQYTLNAAANGIIILGGSIADSWITLSPEYDPDKVQASPAPKR